MQPILWWRLNLPHLTCCSSGGTSTVYGVQGPLAICCSVLPKNTEWGGGVEPFTLKFLWIFLLLMYFASCVFLWTASLFEYCKLNPEQLRIIGYDPSVKLTEGLSLCWSPQIEGLKPSCLGNWNIWLVLKQIFFLSIPLNPDPATALTCSPDWLHH